MKARRFLILFSLLLLYSVGSFAQPSWYGGTPTVTPHVYSEDFRYGINTTGRVYVILMNSNYATPLTSADVRNAVTAGPSGGRISTWNISITAGNTNTVFTVNAINQLGGNIPLIYDSDYTFYFVAANNSGVLQAAPTRIYMKTLACPDIYFLNALQQTIKCVYYGATSVFNISVDPNPEVSGILAGTTWVIDWGDGIITNFTSTTDNDIPTIAMRSHTYVSVTDCNYVFTCGVRNPCGKTFSPQYVSIVHGRDIPSDGDGVLRIVNNAGGSSIINVCAGTQSIITLRDNSIWNCQNPSVPGALTAVPNLDPRNIEWLYGRDPLGAIRNTITGAVNIATLGNAPQASGRLSPIATPTTLSRAITIPATCVAGQYFRVYLKNWNKCNWTDPEYVSTFIDINVIAAPPLPTVPDVTICSGGTRTLTVTSPAVGTLRWYSDALLTTLVGTGATYVPVQTAPGAYTFWVTDQSTTGLLCLSPVADVTLRIRESLAQPGVITGPANTCPSISGLVFSVPADPPVMPFGGPTQYVWSVPAGLTIASGQGTKQITVDVGVTSGNKTISVYLQYTTLPNCNSSTRTKTLTVYSIANNPGVLSGNDICPGGTVSITSTTGASTGAPASAGPTYSWDRAPGPLFTVWTALAGSASTFSEVMATSGTYRYRRTATFGCGPVVTATDDINVFSTANVGGAVSGSNICAGATVNIANNTPASTGTPASAGPTYSWERSPAPFIAWTGLAGSAATFSETMATPGTYRYRRTAAFGCGTDVTATTANIIVYSTTHNAGTIAGTNICPGGTVNITNSLAATTGTPASAGPTYSWDRAPSPFIVWTGLAGSAATFSEVMATSGTYRYRRTATFGCGSAVSTTVDVNVYSTTHNAGAIAVTNICAGAIVNVTSSTAATTGAPASAGPTYSWERSPSPYIVWTALVGSAATFTETMVAAGTYRYRRTASFGCGTPVSTTADVIVYSTTHAAGAIAGTNICAGATVNITNTTPASTGLPASAGPTYSWDRAPGPLFSSWTALVGSAVTFSESMATAGTYRYRRTASFTCGTPVSATKDITVNPNPAPLISGPNDVCAGSSGITYTTSLTAGNNYAWAISGGAITAGAGTNTITVTWGAAGAGWVRVTETMSVTGCAVTTANYAITINPGTPGSAPSFVSGALNICLNGTLNLDVTDVAAASSYIWDYSWVAGTNNATTAVSQISIDLTGVPIGTYTVTVRAANGCGTGPWMPVHTFNINDIPNLSPLTNTVCSDVASAITLSISNSGAYCSGITYNIISINNNGLVASAGAPATGNGLAANVIADDAWTNTTGNSVNVIYAVVPVSSQGCTGLQENVTLTVNPKPVITAGLTETICNGGTSNRSITTTNAPAIAGVTYTWPAPVMTGGITGGTARIIAGGSPITDTFVNNTTAPQTATYTITPFYNGCAGSTQAIVINVNPSAQVSDPADQTVCNAGNTALVTFGTNRTGGATSYSWTNNTPSIGLAASGTGNIAAFAAVNNGTLPVTATITVTPTFTNNLVACTGPAQTFTIIVNPAAQVNDPADQTVCNAGNTILVTFGTDRTGGVTSYSWTNNTPAIGLAASGTGNIAAFAAVNNGTLPVTATITVTPTFTNNLVTCTGPAQTFTITVNPTAQVNDPADQTVCNAGNTTLVTFGSDRTGGVTSYSWTNNTPSIGLAASGTGNIAAFAAVNNGTLPVMATITVTPAFTNNLVACTGPAQTFTITVNPAAQVNDPADQTVCNAGNTTLVTFGTNRTGGATSYSWTNNTPAIGLAASGTGNIAPFVAVNNGTLPVTATITVTPAFTNNLVACTGPAQTFTITVNPTAQVNDPADQTVCNAGNTTLVTFGTNRTGGVTSYSWTNNTPAIGLAASGTGNIAPFVAVNNGTLPVTATITVTPTFTNNLVPCTGPAQTFTITVNPTAQVNDPADQTVCNAGNTTLVTFGTNRTGGSTNYSWTNNTPSIGLAASGTGNIAAFATVNNGTLPVTATITVTPTFTNNLVACTGPVQTFTITVNPAAQVNDPADQTVCNAGNSTLVTFGTDRTGGTTSYSWTNNTTSIGLAASGTGNIAAFAAVNNGTLPVTATITVTPTFTNNLVTCTGPAQTFAITVNPTAQVNDIPDVTYCNNGTTLIIPFTTDRTVGITSYSWTNSNLAIGLGAGAAGNLPSFTAINAGTAPISATITVTPAFSYNSVSCTGPSKTFTITINPTAQVDGLSNQTLCNGVTATAVNFTTNRTGGTYSYSWTNNNTSIGLAAGGSGNIASFTAINAGTLPVTATITVTPSYSNNSVSCTGPTESFTITVNPTPVLSLTLTPADVCSNTPFSYAPNSLTPGTTFNWTRDAVAGITPAGPTSGINNPNETLVNITSFPIIVTYRYTLAANGCTNIQNVTVRIKPEPVITAGQNPSLCSGNALNYRILLNNFTNPGDNVTFTWGAPVLAPVNPAFTGGTARGVASAANISDTFHNTTGLIVSATYTVTPFINGCAGSPETVVVTVGSQPVLDPGLNMFACSNTAIGLILQKEAGSIDPAYYNIISKIVDGTLVDIGNAVLPIPMGAANALSADKYVNTTGVDKIVTYRVQPVLPPDCIGDVVDIVITIRPQPVIFPAQTKTVCSGVPIGKEILLTPANTPAGTLLSWPVPVISDASVQGTAGVNVPADPSGTVHINDQILNYSGGTITATYMVTPVSQFSCAGVPTPVVITINPEPIPKPISGRDKICINDVGIVYSVPATGGSTFHWTVDPAVGVITFNFNTNAIIIDAAAVPGSGNVTVYETNSYLCNGAVSIFPVEVLTKPAAEIIAGPGVVCTNSTQVYSVTNRAGSTYSWTVPGGAAIVGDPSASSITVIFANVGGTISVRETNSAGCITNHTPKAVTVNPLPTATISGGGTICQGTSRNLSVVFTGIGPYTFTYALDGAPQPPVATGANPYTLNVTAAGTYTIINVSDANCTNNGTGTTTVTFFPKPVGIISGTAEMCRGISSVLTMTFTGAAPYTFTYSDGTTPVTVVGHPTNVYTVAVSPLISSTYTLTSFTDANGCAGDVSGSAIITINIPPALTLSGTNLICYNVNTGAVNMTIANGTAPFVFSWTGPNGFTAATQNLSSLEAGYYAVVVIDNKGCTGTANITLLQPPPLAGSAAGTNITCFGADDGRITISGATGGTGTYEFTIDGGAIWQSSPTFTGLPPGTYNVRMRDAVNTTCTLTLNSSLVLTGPAILNATVVKTDVTCFGAANGSIVISGPTGGYGTYGYSVNGGSTWQPSGTFINLTGGIYNVQIRDAANPLCVMPLGGPVTITQPDVLSASVASTPVNCYGSSDGTITISSPAGGHGNYEYSINGGGSWQASGSYTLLPPGTYNVQIHDRDFPACFIVLNGSLSITQPAMLSGTVSPVNVTCNGAADGRITITLPQGGYGTYEYSIDGGTTWDGTGSYTGLAHGSYNVRIRDAAHPACFIILNPGIVITQPATLSAVLLKSDVTCSGASNGTITIINPAGGYGTYEYTIDGWATAQTTGTYTGLPVGVYNVQIRDRAHPTCIRILDALLGITEPAILSADVAFTVVTCNGVNNGTITISNAAGGYGTWSYSINNGTSWQGSGIFTNLAPATYRLRIRDAANPACIVPLPDVIITQPPALFATAARTNVTCFGASDGTITINGSSGGYGAYEYTINGGISWQPGIAFTGLIPGFYNVMMRDLANPACIFIVNGSLNITQPPMLAANVAKTNVTCNGANDGTITVSGATGGYGTYDYSIGGGIWQATGNFTGLSPATYSVSIRDRVNPGCVAILDNAVVISQLAGINATATATIITCNGANDGIITISGQAGGSGSYQYTINGGTSWQGSSVFTNLANGTYNVMMRDAVSPTCVLIINPALPITQPAALSASIASNNISCFGGNDGTITISGASGGYGTYEYSINGGGSWNTTGTFTALIPGFYNIIMRDAAHTGCITVLNNSYAITQPVRLSATVTKTDVSCRGMNDGRIDITSPSGGYGTYEYSIDGGLSWVGSGNFINLVPATYHVHIRDAANIACSVVLYPNLVITEPILLALTSTGDVLLDCFGNTDGTGTFYSSGGTMPYIFTVVSNTTGAIIAAPGFNSQTFYNAGAGSITMAVTDFNGCFAQATINISQPLLLTPGTVGPSQVMCSGADPAPLAETVPASGGPGTYSYQWQYAADVAGPFVNIAGATLNVYTPVAGATSTLYYRRMVTSGFCPPVYSNVVEVKVNPLPVALLTGGESICPAQTSVLKVNLMAGTAPFELNIQNHGVVTGYISGTDIVVSPAATTTYTLISVKDANGCMVMAPSANLIGSATVTVRALPVITTSPVNKTTCEFGVVTFSVAASGSDLTYQWFENRGSGFNPVTDGGVYFGATGSTLSLFGATRLMNGYIYHAVVTGCSSSVTSADATLTVNTIPEIITQPRDTTICMGNNATFRAVATGTGISYQWQVNKGAGFINIVNDANFGGAGTNTLTITNVPGTFNNYIIRLIVTGSCGVPVFSNFVVLRVNTPPVVTLNPVSKTACENTGPVIFTAYGSGLIDSLRWQVFSGGVWSDVHENAVYSGSSSQQLTLINIPLALNGNQYRLALKGECMTVNTNAATLTVHSSPVVNFAAIDPIHACGNVPVVLNGNPTGGSGIWTTHLWTGDIGPLNNYFIQSPTFNSQIAGTFNLNYKVKDSNGCFAGDDVTIIVDAPDAMFTADRISGCTPSVVTFTKDMTAVARFWWDFNDGSPIDSVNANPVHTFTNSSPSAIGYYNVKLKVRSPGGCVASFTSMITVYPAIDATFTASKLVICSGNPITFISIPGASKYFWEFGDGISGYSTNTTSHVYTNFTPVPIIQQVRLTTTSFYNCTDVKTLNITVMPMPLPQFTAVPVNQIYNPAGNPVTFTNSTNPGTWTYLWKFGDGAISTAQNPSHTYMALGNFNVVLIVSNASCSDSVKHQVSVLATPPVANFDPIPSGCEPLDFVINNTSLNTSTPGTTYKWDFGDGSISTAKNPKYTYSYPGVYRVELIVTGPGGSSIKSQVVNVYRSPRASFEVLPLKVTANDESVRFFNLSQGADSFLWDFGDGDTSKLRDPFHRYMEEGIYEITLWAYSNSGCANKYVLTPGIVVEPPGNLRFATVFTPNKNGPIEIDHLPMGGIAIDQFFFPPVREKVINYKLQIFNRLGVLVFVSNDINIPWNGYYKGTLCPQGVYVWFVEGKFANGKPFKKVGDITLLH